MRGMRPVTVKSENPIKTGVLYAGFETGAVASIYFVINKFDAGESFQDLTAIVGRTVVYDHDFVSQPAFEFFFNGSQNIGNCPALVISRHHDRNFWQRVHGVMCIWQLYL